MASISLSTIFATGAAVFAVLSVALTSLQSYKTESNNETELQLAAMRAEARGEHQKNTEGLVPFQ
jgi:hypothetical protein